MPAIPSLPHVRNAFTAQQEQYLGDIEAEWLEKNNPVIRDEKFNRHAESVAARILALSPQSQVQVRIVLIDGPGANAFTVGTGRIYVTRQMLAVLRNDDELAGLLGHETAHVLTHQNAVVVTQVLRDLLGVTSVTDRRDISEKWNRLFNDADRNEKALREAAYRIERQEEIHQYQADRFALYAAGAAGFSPQSYVEFFDRVAETHGKTGNFFTDLLGATTPDEKRLRKLHRSLRGLPPSCRQIAAPSPSVEFRLWQADVLADPALASSRGGVTAEPHRGSDQTELRNPHE